MNAWSELRLQMRRRRKRLSQAERISCAQRLVPIITRSAPFRRSRRIACYLSNDGEMDLSPLISRLWAMGKQAYLPVLHGPRLWFLPHEQGAPLRQNRFGIPEPQLPPISRCPPLALDLVLMPLVAFDDQGNRLGMGGGYYDRTFAYLRDRRHWMRPWLIGIAYDFQRVKSLPARHWDVPLHGVATEGGLSIYPRRASPVGSKGGGDC